MSRARLDAASAECLVLVEKAGLLSAVGHDLTLRVERFEIELEGGAAQGRFDASSLRVVAPASLPAKDRREIEATIAATILVAPRHPWILFQSTSIAGEGPMRRIEGTLSIRGNERPIALSARRDGERALIESLIHQPDFGIRPFSAMLGALRIKPQVLVRLTAPWPGSAAPAP